MKNRKRIIVIITLVVLIFMISFMTKEEAFPIKHFAQKMFENERRITDQLVMTQEGNWTRTFKLKSLDYGYFVNHDNEVLIKYEEINSPHVNGMTPVRMAVFDLETKDMVSDLLDFHSDVYRMKLQTSEVTGQQSILYLGQVSYQGHHDYSGGVYTFKEDVWQQSFPNKENYFQECFVLVIGDYLLEFSTDKNSEFCISNLFVWDRKGSYKKVNSLEIGDAWSILIF